MMILSLAPGRKKLIFVPLEKAAGQVECVCVGGRLGLVFES